MLNRTGFRLLMVFPYRSTFIKRDIEILSRHFLVRTCIAVIEPSLPISTLAALLRLARGVMASDLVYVWLADRHAAAAIRLGHYLKRPVVVVIGGYEVAAEPEFNYGLLLNSGTAATVRYILNKADLLLPVDEGLRVDGERFFGRKIPNIVVVPTGHDSTHYAPEGEKEPLCITVCATDNIGRARLKGVHTFIETAALLPQIQFAVIGVHGEARTWLESRIPPNVQLIGLTPEDEVIPWYQRAGVYAQLSRREGLPNALCEAMLCGCIPVGARVQGVTSAIGEDGLYAPFGDAKATASLIEQALILSQVEAERRAVRERIKTLYPPSRREETLIPLLKNLLERASGEKGGKLQINKAESRIW